MNLQFLVSSELIENAKEKLIAEGEMCSSDSEFEKKVIIVALCLKYNFTYKFVNDYVFVYSIIDEWCFPYNRDLIPLQHRNKLHTVNQFHFQKKFDNIIYLLQYINKHDNFCYRPRRKYTAIKV